MIQRDNMKLVRKRVKYARIRIEPTGSITVTVPHGYSDAAINRLIEKKSGWIDKHLRKIALVEEHRPKVGENEIFLFGRNYEIDHDPDLGRRSIIDPESYTVSMGEILNGPESREVWYRNQAREFLEYRVDHFRKSHGFTYNRIYIRGQKTRWGSCSSKKNLSFNWKLMLLPHPLIDYVVIHELAHTEHLNHSKKFWQRVGEICPEWKTARLRLKEFVLPEIGL